VLGRVVSISGAQAVVRLADEAWSPAGAADVSVGGYIAIRTRGSLVIGVMSDMTCDGDLVSGHVDMLGEIIGARPALIAPSMAFRGIPRSATPRCGSASANCG
jgi:riboflavin synthase alpha subunit